MSVAQVLAALLRAGKSVLLPFGDHKRYDLVIEEEDGRFLRVQCKTGRIINGAVWFPTSSIHSRSRTGQKTARKSYLGQADLFGVFCPDNGKVYLVPIQEVRQNAGCLRVESARNNQRKQIRRAEVYELGDVVAMGAAPLPGGLTGMPEAGASDLLAPTETLLDPQTLATPR